MSEPEAKSPMTVTRRRKHMLCCVCDEPMDEPMDGTGRYVRICEGCGEPMHDTCSVEDDELSAKRGIGRRTNNGTIYVGIGVRHDGEMM